MNNAALQDNSLPRDNGELVFAAPWEARALAVAVALVDGLDLPWDAFRSRLMTSIAEAPDRPYYESWGEALESLVLDLGLTTSDALDAATPTERAPPSRVCESADGLTVCRVAVRTFGAGYQLW